jgi:hypothetical protein
MVVTLTQLDATPTTRLPVGYDVRGSAGGIARLRFQWRGEAGRMDVGGRQYHIRRDESDGAYVFERRGRRLATARQPSEFSRSLQIDFGGDHWELHARPMQRAFKVMHRGRRMAEVGPATWYKRHARLNAPEGIDEELGYFVLLLALLLWRRRRIA